MQVVAEQRGEEAVNAVEGQRLTHCHGMGPNADDMVMQTRLGWLGTDAAADNII
jgi:hypothetical protein